MSWLDKIQSDYTITTGDGKSYTPNWVNASKGIEYNIAAFDFKETAGTLVKRGMPKGNQYAIEIFFQGEDHLDTAAAFEASAADPRAWAISHPLYGQLLVQPVRMTFDNAEMNVTHITGLVLETIADGPNKVTISAPDKIQEDKVSVDAQLAGAYAVDVPAPKVIDLKAMQKSLNGFFLKVSAGIDTNTGYSGYLNLYNQANTLITSASAGTADLVSHFQQVMSFPATLGMSVTNRLALLGYQFDALNESIADFTLQSLKRLFQLTGGTILTSMFQAAVTNLGAGYDNRAAVLKVIGSLLRRYNSFLANLDSLQSLNGGQLTSFIPSPAAITALSQLAGYTVSSLLVIAANSRQERTITLEEDSNIILVADRLLGLREDDSTIDELMRVNEIGLSEILELKKGRQITYYV